jgi:hypothetical protein
LGRFIPIWRNVDTIAHLRISGKLGVAVDALLCG